MKTNPCAARKQKMKALQVCLVAMTVALMMLGGCGKFMEKDTGTETSLEAERPGSEDETDTVKQTEAIPDTIAPFPSKADKDKSENENGGDGEDRTEKNGEDAAGEWDPDEGRRIFLATDIHYLSRELTDGGEYFQRMVEHGDGKVVTYIDQITDAFFEEVIEEQPDVLILSGDLTLEGEKQSHQELAEKLYEVQDAGITVLVIPGNHDINNRQAACYEADQRLPAEYTTPEEFREIYADFGYDEAASEDAYSLSYLYEYDDETWFLMLDTCMYTPKAKVGGSISQETYDWIEDRLEEAWDVGVDVIPVGHHNLLDESEIYVDDCMIEHGEQLARMLEDWGITLFLSGHLHVQHYDRNRENRGIWEAVTSSLATPACKYGEIYYYRGGEFFYQTNTVDVEGWALRNDREEEDLLNFESFREPFLLRVFYNQSYDALQEIPELTEDERIRMSDLYSFLNYHYYQGTACEIRDDIIENPDYELWLNDGSFTILSDYVQYIIEDAVHDYNRISSVE